MFRSAKPVFCAGKQTEMNVQLGFYADIPALPNTVLRLCGTTMYQVYVNGSFYRSGPARTAHGRFRVDELDLTPLLTGEVNTVVILLQSSYCNSFVVPKAPGFLQAEIVSGERVLAHTAKDGTFHCVHINSRVQKTLRFSFQRMFTEAYRLNEQQGRFVAYPTAAGYPSVELEEQEEKSLLPRDVYPVDGEFEPVQRLLAAGKVSHLPTPVYPDKREYHPSPIFDCFAPEDIDVNLAALAHAFEFHPDETADATADALTLSADGYALLDLGRELTGLVSLQVHVTQPTKLVLLFDEILRDGKVDATRLDCCNAICYELQSGNYKLLSMEAYSLRYLTVIAVGQGEAHVQNVGLRRVGFPKIDKVLQSDDPVEQEIYAAAVESFRQNVADIYMDCPSRERAGWLCDSFFTSRVEYALTGKCVVERAFLDNFLYPESFPHLPKGMLPMCYPGDQTDSNFIPNWAMWYVLQLEEYYARSGDRTLVDRAKERMLDLYHFFTAYENADGLLERLPAWVFVEWSQANALVQHVNYPSNALYAAMLDVLYRLYDLPELHDKAERIRAHIRAVAYLDNGFFCDNSVRNESGELHLSGECTEVCQYYMFYFGVATPDSHCELWRILCEEFGPDRVKLGLYPHIHPANSFVGNYMRQDLLFREGRYDQILAETRGYFHYMAQKTGTLWENATDFASCNHGFASHVAVWLLGIRNG